MGGMGYTTTLGVIVHTLHSHVDRCMQTEDVTCQIMKNNLQRVMQEWVCTSKAEMTRETEARSWDETTINVWHNLGTCDHLLTIESWNDSVHITDHLDITILVLHVVKNLNQYRSRTRDIFVRQDVVSKFKEISEILHFCGGDFSMFLWTLPNPDDVCYERIHCFRLDTFQKQPPLHYQTETSLPLSCPQPLTAYLSSLDLRLHLPQFEWVHPSKCTGLPPPKATLSTSTSFTVCSVICFSLITCCSSKHRISFLLGRSVFSTSMVWMCKSWFWMCASGSSNVSPIVLASPHSFRVPQSSELHKWPLSIHQNRRHPWDPAWCPFRWIVSHPSPRIL